jgi:hypothetical protein
MANPTDFFKTKALVEKRRNKKLKDITFKKYVNFDGIPLEIQNREDWGCYRPALHKIHQRLKFMTNNYHKVLCIRVDFKVTKEIWADKQFSRFIENEKKRISKAYKLTDIVSGWGRERNLCGSHHYHLILVIDGHKVQYPSKIHESLIQRWKDLGHSSAHWCDHHMITNSFDDDFKKAYCHLSYITKVYTKDEQPMNARNFGFSRLPS